MKKYKVIHIGLGPLGKKIVGFMSERENIEIVGAMDINHELRGQNLSDVCEIKMSSDVKVCSSVDELKGVNADVILLTTVSSLEKLCDQISDISVLGINIVSTCEELSYPFNVNDTVAQKIDEIAKQAGITVLGTGVNPGFCMDYLPSALTAVAQQVDKVTVWRLQDASPRRVPFQKKIGAGLKVAEFNKLAKDKIIRHVGLRESVNMIASALSMKLDNYEETIEPIVAEKEITSGAFPIKAGDCAGVKQLAYGYVNGEKKIELIFVAAVGEPKSEERILIEGRPNLNMVIEGGINGDIATSAITINAIKSVCNSVPGLKTMLDVPVPTCF